MTRRYHTLDGVRGIAALAVVFLHGDGFGLGRDLFKSAYLAVDLFFLMSGFVIAAAYEERIRKRGVLAFLSARLIRLWPMLILGLFILPVYYLYLRIHFDAWPVAPMAVVQSFALGLFYLPSTLPGQTSIYPLNGPAWSLMFEMAANVTYALALPVLSKRVLGGIVILSGISLVVLYLRKGDLNAGWEWANLAWGVPRTAFSFFLGVLAFRLRLPQINVPTPAILLLAAISLAAHPLFAVFLGFPLVLLAAVGDQTQSRAMKLAGAMSYPLYAVHWPLLKCAWRAVQKVGLGGIYGDFATLALILVCAYAALKLWDEPVRARLSRLLLPAISPSAASSPSSGG